MNHLSLFALLFLLTSCVTVLTETPISDPGQAPLSELPGDWLGFYRPLDSEVAITEIGTEYLEIKVHQDQVYDVFRFMYVKDTELDTLGFRREALTLIYEEDSTNIQTYPLITWGEGYRYLSQRIFRLDLQQNTLRIYAEDTTAPSANILLTPWNDTHWTFNMEEPESGGLWIPFILTRNEQRLELSQLNGEEVKVWAESNPKIQLSDLDSQLLLQTTSELWPQLLDNQLLWESVFVWEDEPRWDYLAEPTESNSNATKDSTTLILLLTAGLMTILLIIRMIRKRGA